MKKIDEFRINWTADHEQYFPGHSTVFTRYTHSATGSGDTLREAFEDTLEQLSEDWDVACVEPEMLSELTAQAPAGNLDIAVTDDCGECGEDCAACAGDWHYCVSVDVREKGGDS